MAFIAVIWLNAALIVGNVCFVNDWPPLYLNLRCVIHKYLVFQYNPSVKHIHIHHGKDLLSSGQSWTSVVKSILTYDEWMNMCVSPCYWPHLPSLRHLQITLPSDNRQSPTYLFKIWLNLVFNFVLHCKVIYTSHSRHTTQWVQAEFIWFKLTQHQ